MGSSWTVELEGFLGSIPFEGLSDFLQEDRRGLFLRVWGMGLGVGRGFGLEEE